MTSAPLVAGVELGGTKCVCLVGTGPDDIRAQASVPTGEDANATLEQIKRIFSDWLGQHGPISALGIASFGPIELNRASRRYGFITSTPKVGWRDTDVVGRLMNMVTPRVPVGFDTDVNGAALAEGRWGAATNLTNFAYVTVGTGVGVGLVVGGRRVQGFSHPEVGHIRIVRKTGDFWPGSCAFHGDCVEGLAAGPAITARCGIPADRVPVESPVWDLVAHALAQMLHALVLTTAPQRILMGGGVMDSRPDLLGMVRRQLVQSLNGYSAFDVLSGGIEAYIAAPGLGPLAGPLGALALAADASSTLFG